MSSSQNSQNINSAEFYKNATKKILTEKVTVEPKQKIEEHKPKLEDEVDTFDEDLMQRHMEDISDISFKISHILRDELLNKFGIEIPLGDSVFEFVKSLVPQPLNVTSDRSESEYEDEDYDY